MQPSSTGVGQLPHRLPRTLITATISAMKLRHVISLAGFVDTHQAAPLIS